jgi:hypothetical protein
MNRILKKFILILLITLIFLSTVITNNSYGSDVLNRFKGTSGELTGKTELTTIMASVLDVIRLAGAGIAVIILLVIGIKYAIASVGERADIKKYAINYVIGALVLFGATGILSILKNVITESISGE